MFTKHLLKVIIGFCGMIIFGLVTLVIVDSLKDNDQKAQANPVVLPVTTQTPVKAPFKKAPASKPTTPTKVTPR